MTQPQCQQCSKSFRIDDQDLGFYKRIAVPPPTLCPDCRQQRRLAWRNERTFYERACDLCHKDIISMYHADAEFPVYCHDCWWSDKWDPLDYGRDIDFTRPFFEQFHELQMQVPRVALANNKSENSPYINDADRNKNCYMTTTCNDNEDCLYGYWMVKNVNCVDISYAVDNRFCYELIDGSNNNQVRFAQDSRDCSDSWFLYDCSNCSSCFGCTNLRNKEYHIFNQPYSKEEYMVKVAELTKDRASLESARTEFQNLKKKAIHKYVKGVNNENSTGGGLKYCNNAKQCFDCVELVDSAYVYGSIQSKDSYDLTMAHETELSYEVQGVMGYGMRFGYAVRYCPDGTYLDHCHNSHDVFGCIGLRKQEFCILNRKYSEAEYIQLRDQLIEHMTQTKEFGEYFPIQYSIFAYNETAAMTYYPLDENTVVNNGWRWKEDAEKATTTPTAEVGDECGGIDVAVTKQVYQCVNCQRAYKIVRQELELYNMLGLPLPQRCFYCRARDRENMRNPWKLFTRQCMCTQTDHEHTGQCVSQVESNYSPEETAIIYCEQCYNKEIY